MSVTFLQSEAFERAAYSLRDALSTFDTNTAEFCQHVRENLPSILAKATDGRFCRTVDHMTECCDCREIARFIGGELSDAAVDRARGAT